MFEWQYIGYSFCLPVKTWTIDRSGPVITHLLLKGISLLRMIATTMTVLREPRHQVASIPPYPRGLGVTSSMEALFFYVVPFFSYCSLFWGLQSMYLSFLFYINAIQSKAKKEWAHIIFWQETQLSSPEHEKIKKLGFRHTYYSSFQSGRKRGVAIMIPNSVQFEFQTEIKDQEGRYVMVKGKMDGKEITLLNVYAPPGSKKFFFKTILDLLISQTTGVMICAGDFNLILDTKLDTTNKNRNLTNIERWFKRRVKYLGILDVWRDFHKKEKQYTFYSCRHDAYSRPPLHV